jgi:hypothetical protein
LTICHPDTPDWTYRYSEDHWMTPKNLIQTFRGLKDLADYLGALSNKTNGVLTSL